MAERINKFLYSSIIISILLFVLGMIFLIVFISLYINIKLLFNSLLSVVLIINGIYFIVEKESSFFFSGFLTLGIIQILIGVVLILNPILMKTLFPIFVGIVMVTKSALDFRISLLLKKYGYNNWLSIFIFSVISIICGLIIIVNPTTIGTIAITTYLGLILSIYAISNIIDSIFFIKNIKEITKLLKK